MIAVGAPEQTQAGDVGARARALPARAEAHRRLLVPLALAVLATALYLPYALDSGFFLDDWGIYASYRDAGSDWEGIANCFDDLGHRSPQGLRDLVEPAPGSTSRPLVAARADAS